MSERADRHSGTLDGTLEDLGERTLSVGIEIEPGAGAGPAVQHTAAMTINLLCRLEGLVSEVRVAASPDRLRPRSFPLAPRARALGEAILTSAEAIGGVPTSVGELGKVDRLLRIGPGPAGPGLRVHGEGYCGAISEAAIASVSASSLPFGPYIAACLAAGEIFRSARLSTELFDPLTALSYSAWDGSLGDGRIHQPGDPLGPTSIDFGLAGVGAVGCALIHALWACPELEGEAIIADYDQEGIEGSNLNRCVLFAAADIGMPKASSAARICADSSIDWIPHDGLYTRSALPRVPALLASAVDTNHSRDQLQQGFWPARLLAASTEGLRAEFSRCGPPGTGPCLRCFNPPEVDIPDDVLREDLRALSEIELEAFARKIGRPAALVRRWAEEGGCSEVGDAALRHLRDEHEPPRVFAVGFVSVLAGTILAAELVKEHLAPAPGLGNSHQSAKFQFIRPTAAANGRFRAVGRDPDCPACAADQPGLAVWRARAESWVPPSNTTEEVR